MVSSTLRVHNININLKNQCFYQSISDVSFKICYFKSPMIKYINLS